MRQKQIEKKMENEDQTGNYLVDNMGPVLMKYNVLVSIFGFPFSRQTVMHRDAGSPLKGLYPP